MFSTNMLLQSVIVVFTMLSVYVGGEVFSSIAVMEDVVQIQGQVLELFDSYVAKQHQVFEEVSLRVSSFRLEYEKARKNPAEYIGNPIDSYRLIKQLYLDWHDIINLLTLASNEFESGVANLQTSRFYPEQDDIVGSAEAILRLQHTYKLNTKDLAEGIINGVKRSLPLNSHDCYIIGLYISDTKSYNMALQWQNVALEKFQTHKIGSFDKSSIMESIAYNKYESGNISSAMEVYRQMERDYPDHPKLSEYIDIVKSALENKEFMESLVLPYVDPHTTKDNPKYLQLCREAIDLPPSFKKRLKCFYLSTYTPFTKLAPFKVETHFDRPDVYVYHDILYDEEIEYMIKEIKPKLKRAKVVSKDGKDTTAKIRISMNNWLSDDYSPIIRRINQRFVDMTGLDLRFAEAIQLADYGIGGFYGLHLDFSTRNVTSSAKGKRKRLKNRIATILVYMTDVEKGGNTVFPHMGVSVRPKKGSAVFWYNLLTSGEGDMGTWHAACPVLLGNKWVVNKWIRLPGNEFVRPCGLEYSKEGHQREYPELVKRKPYN